MRRELETKEVERVAHIEVERLAAAKVKELEEKLIELAKEVEEGRKGLEEKEKS